MVAGLRNVTLYSLVLLITPLRLHAEGSDELIAGRYKVREQTVYDTQTGLEWQRHASDVDRYSWKEAKRHCAELELAGQRWRLPTKPELESIVAVLSIPTINRKAFPDTPPRPFWTSTSYEDRRDTAWIILFQDGTYSATQTDREYAVRCVRDGARPGERPADR